MKFLNNVIKRITQTKETKEIFYKSFSSLVFRVLSYILGFLFTFIIARFFKLDTQGIFSIVFTLVALITLFSKLGIQTAMVKWLSNYFYNNELGEAKYFFLKIYKLTFIIALVLAFSLFFCAENIAILFFHKENLIKPIKIISFCIPFFASTEIIANYFRSKKNIIAFSFYNFTAKFVFPLLFLLVIIIFTDNRITEIAIYSYSFGVILIGVIAFIHVNLDLVKIKSKSKKFITHKKILKTSIPLLFTSSLVMLMWWSDTFILGVYKSEADVGIYSVAVKLATISSFIYNAVISILLPKIAQYYKNNDVKKLKHTIQYSSRLIFIATIPIALVLAIFPKFFLGVFGDAYKSGNIILLLLLAAQFTNSFTGPVGPFLNMSGHEKQQLYFICIALLINLVVSLYLVNDYGGEGVALGSALGMITWNVIGAIYIKVKFGYQTWIKI